MRYRIRKYLFLFSIIFCIYSSVFIVTAVKDNLSKEDLLNGRENDEGGEGKTTQFAELENDFKDTEEDHNNPLVILGNQVKRDGSNEFGKYPTYIILAIASLFAIIMIYTIRKK